jgi:hypothetical protein
MFGFPVKTGFFHAVPEEASNMEPLETSASLAFHGVAYVVTVCVRDQTLELQVEVDDARGAVPESCWTAQFPANCAWLDKPNRAALLKPG